MTFKRVLGLMSGTSLDGIDISLIDTNGYIVRCRYGFKTYGYSNELRIKLKSILGCCVYSERIKDIEYEFTYMHYRFILQFCKEFNVRLEDIDLISFHGQTIYHGKVGNQVEYDPKFVYGKNVFNFTIGDGKLLSRLIKKDVIYNLRKNDILNGGQGAPLAPIYHACLAISMMNDGIGIRFPIVFVNIGGISNITYIDVKDSGAFKDIKKMYDNLVVYSFDVGPGNCILDDWISLKTNNKYRYDKNGMFSRKGNINTLAKWKEKHLDRFVNHPYFKKLPPKSLDRNDFTLQYILNSTNYSHLNINDIASIIVECTAISIVHQTSEFCPKTPSQLIISGGGRLNSHLISRISYHASTKNINSVSNSDTFGINGDGIESECWGFIGLRGYNNEYISLPTTTGVSDPTTGGDIIKYIPKLSKF